MIYTVWYFQSEVSWWESNFDPTTPVFVEADSELEEAPMSFPTSIQMGVSNGWLVYFMENPNLNMDDSGVPPWLWKPSYRW